MIGPQRGALYGVPLAIALPLVLAAWARATAGVVRIHAVDSPALGLAIALIGTALVWRYVPYPVLTGLALGCIGASIATGSASGLWLVSPVVILCCAAYVVGRAGRRHVRRFDWGAPTGSPEAGVPCFRERALLYLFVLAPWLALYEGVLAIGIPPDAIAGVLPFERHMQVLEWTQVFYGSTYLIALAAPLIANTRADLRQYAMRGLWTMAIAYPLFVLVPLISPKRAFVPHTVPGRLLAWEQSLDSSVAAFPSFHVIWSMLAAEVFARRWPSLRWCFYGWAALVAVSCVTTGQHSILDVVGGVATVVLVLHGRNVWLGAIGFAERISASLSATRSAMRLGPERFASAGFYLAAGIVLALCVAGTLPGASLRPGVPGVNPWLMPGALAASMPWVLAAGSLRRLAGRPVEFPLYSFTYRVAAAVVILRLWVVASPLHLIVGVGLILAGIGSFVEAAWYPNPRSRFRRWLAVACGVGGALVTAMGHSATAPSLVFAPKALLPGLAASVVVAVATGGRSRSALS